MKIFTAQQIKAADAYTTTHEPVDSIDLMERAATAFCSWFTSKFDIQNNVLVVAGAGNNGGDALAIARILSDEGYTIDLKLALPNATGSKDFQLNLKRLPKAVNYMSSIKDNYSIVIDGIFGSGLSRPIKGEVAELIHEINKLDAVKVAIDIASGLSCDSLAVGNVVIMPDFTLSFELPKLAFMLPENDQYVGNWQVAGIGLHPRFIEKENASYLYITKDLVRNAYRQRAKFDHKGNFGHALLVAGSYGKMGAAVLAAKAMMRSGVGLGSALLPEAGYQILQISIPEVMCIATGSKHVVPVKSVKFANYNALGIGPGLGQSDDTAGLISQLLTDFTQPIVCDADAINILASNKHLIDQLPVNSILTPHVGEFNRLVGPSVNSKERLEKQIKFSKKHGVIIILKGAHTSITNTNGTVWFNSTGNPGMATAGSGDVLTGLVTGLLAQGYEPINAAIMGVYVHGLAGDLAKNKLGEASMLASDMLKRISDAFILINK